MKLHRILICLSLLASNTFAELPQLSREELAAVQVTPSAERDAAVIYMREMSFYLSRMASRCRKELKMPASELSEPEQSLWGQTNYRYSAAAVRYDGKRAMYPDAFTQYQTNLDKYGVAQEKAYADADALLKPKKSRVQICNQFFTDSQTGRFDITPGHPHYEVLEGLARELFDPRQK
ncbi:hypothetical protein GCM10011613_32910 [Cellvibrio zantedeschiae]|uniref:Uncharacterized protein n=1 Tax=Cellvibrio zantedeschiae TaxID=1237077 RepID=A0ABQ3B9X7_9GAMM|nr:hypothetical protein [Cellvibrio zantedeschiae]GGY85212.1 hypothetical protein GCM10011613_32910 [Cellvibrio zantedeschiae]